MEGGSPPTRFALNPAYGVYPVFITGWFARSATHYKQHFVVAGGGKGQYCGGMQHRTAHVPEPALDLRDDTPVSAAFGDVYFSRSGGIAETEHVFLAGNSLPERWKNRHAFTIGELGFGTGLNFLVAWKCFCETADADATLHYISIEKYPFTVAKLRAVLALQPKLAAEAAALLAAYPLRLPGIHRIHLPRCVLTLCFGDVAHMLPQLDTKIDAWFLDGFSPAKNPDMWSNTLFAQLGRLSAADATFATFTSAGAVRRGLQTVGFTVEKVPGFGRKREMLKGVLPTDADSQRKSCVAEGEPQRGRGQRSVGGVRPPTNIILLGAGIAGATLANALAQRGFAVTVLDHGNIAVGASGNAAGVLFPQLTKQWNVSAAWYFTAYGFALRQLKRWKAEGLEFASDAPGMLRLPRHAEEEAQLRSLNATLGLDASIVHWLEREEASNIAGVHLQTGAAFFPQGTWISPLQLCRALLQHPNIILREQTTATSIARHGNGWAITLANGEIINADICCISAAQESAALLAEYGIRLNSVGGQVSEIAASNAATKLRSILCHKGYIIPQKECVAEGESRAAGVERGVSPPSVNRYLIGATYHREDMHAVTDARHAENIAELNNALPNWFNGMVISGRSALRATTPDRLPYIGAVDDGLYISAGHGSRGLLSAPLAAEMIASAVCGELSPVSNDLSHAVRPLRFKKL